MGKETEYCANLSDLRMAPNLWRGYRRSKPNAYLLGRVLVVRVHISELHIAQKLELISMERLTRT